MLEPAEPEAFDVVLGAIQDRPELHRRVDRHVDGARAATRPPCARGTGRTGVLLSVTCPFGLDPDRLLVVDDLAGHLDRVRDEPGIGPEDRLDPVVVGELLGVRLELEDDLGPPREPLGRLDRERARTRPTPTPSRIPRDSSSTGP